MAHDHTALNRGDPAPLTEVADRFREVETPWWVAGGFAIELAVGHRVRDHGDVDVLLLRRDQSAVQLALPDWKWWAADPPGSLRPWVAGEALPESVRDIWCQPGPGEPWRIQFMLDEVEEQEWVSCRDPRVRRPIDTLGLISAGGIPYLTPEVQLFYKAKDPRPKDETDFDATLPVLTDNQRQWLVHAVTQTYGPHPRAAKLSPMP